MARPTRVTAAAPALLLAVLLLPGCGAAVDLPADGTPSTSTDSVPGATARSTTTSPTPPAAAPVTPTARRVRTIVLDPGHSGHYVRRTDRTGLNDIDYPNDPEIYEMFDVSVCVARSLRADRYRVLLTKAHVRSTVGHRERATIANRARADLAISVHDDHGVGPRFEATYSQRGARKKDGSYPVMYRGTGKHRTVFTRTAVARRSDTYAKAIARERAKTQHRSVSVTQNSYDGRKPLEPGNLALVQLFATVPWVYNEMGALTSGKVTRAMSIASERAYAAGLLAGIEKAVPLVPGRANPPTRSAASLTGCLRRQVEPKPGQLTRPRRYLPAGF